MEQDYNHRASSMKLYTANNGDTKLHPKEVKNSTSYSTHSSYESYKPTVTEAKSNYTCQLHQGKLKNES